jgi:serine/threonine protein kinase
VSAAAIERQIGSTVAGKYRLLRVLGRGGMGVVYEAEHGMTRRRVAVKVLHAHHRESADAAKRFINEAQASGRVSHPNVVEVLDAGEDSDGSLYLVLELLTGQDLATHLMRRPRLEVAETVTIIAQVLQALVVAHRQGIIHRDIKPENIFLTRGVTGDTHVKILDFGISKAIGPSEDGPALSVTQTNTTVGTPHYMAPEQARGERGIDTRADLWAVGVVLYECLAGRVPFDGETYNDQIVRVITEPHLPLGTMDVPLELSRLVDKALEKDRNRRYARAADMLADLRTFIERHPEYASVSPHLLREPAPAPAPMSVARPDNPTVETTRDPAFDPSLPPPSDTLRSAPVADVLASLFDTAHEDAPTTVHIARPDEITGPVQLPPLAGTKPPSIPPQLPLRSRASTMFSQLGPRARMGLVGGALFATALIVGALAAIVWRPRRTEETTSPLAAAMVTLRFVGIPPNAQLVVGGTPIYGSETAVLPRGNVPTPIEVSAPGYQPARFSLVPDQDQTVPLMLQPSVEAPSAPPAPAPSPARIRAAASPLSANESAFERTVRGSATARPNPGYLTVIAATPCTLAIDREPRGDTPLQRLSIAPGPHQVICRTSTGALRTRNVAVTAGQETVVEFSP